MWLNPIQILCAWCGLLFLSSRHHDENTCIESLCSGLCGFGRWCCGSSACSPMLLIGLSLTIECCSGYTNCTKGNSDKTLQTNCTFNSFNPSLFSCQLLMFAIMATGNNNECENWSIHPTKLKSEPVQTSLSLTKRAAQNRPCRKYMYTK